MDKTGPAHQINGFAMRAALVLLAHVFVVSAASASCADRFFVVSGQVQDKEGAPATGAMVGVSWLEDGSPAGPAMARADESGRFSIPLEFPTYSGAGFLGGDRCRARLEEVSVAAYAGPDRSGYMRVEVGNRSPIRVGTLRIDTPIRNEPLWPEDASSTPRGTSKDRVPQDRSRRTASIETDVSSDPDPAVPVESRKRFDTRPRPRRHPP